MTMNRPPLTAVPLGMPAFPARVRPTGGAPASGEPAGGPVLRMGLDIGSTTVKLVVLPESSPGAPVPEPLYSEYRRHHADVRGEVIRLLAEAARRVPRARVVGAVTGIPTIMFAASVLAAITILQYRMTRAGETDLD